MKKSLKWFMPVALMLLAVFGASKMAWAEYLTSYNGVSVYGQCVTFVQRYASQYMGITVPTIGQYHSCSNSGVDSCGAHWIWDDSRLQPTNTDRIANDGSNYPQPQDIIVWNTQLAYPYGHIAIVDSASSRSNVVVVDSNWGLDEQGQRHTVSITNKVSGWFRKKGSGGDTTPPYGNVDNPAPNTDGVTVSGTLSLNGWAKDDSSGVKEVQLLIDDQPGPIMNYGYNRPDVGGNFGFGYDWDTYSVSNGSHTLKIKVTDNSAAGNVNDFNNAQAFKRVINVNNAIRVGELPNHTFDQRIVDAFNRNGGSATVGNPTNFVYGNGPVGYSDFAQEFGGGGGGSIIANGTAWWVHGPIWNYYAYTLGGVYSALGRPTSDEQPCGIFLAAQEIGWTYKGRFHTFDHGDIYYHQDGPHVGEIYMVFDDFRTKYNSLQCTASSMGFPISDQETGATRSDAGARGWTESLIKQHFEGGDFYRHSSGPRAGNVYKIQGLVRDKYDSLGGSVSELGAPATDLFTPPQSPFGTVGEEIRCEGGGIYRHYSGPFKDKAFAVYAPIDAKYSNNNVETGGPLGFPTSDAYSFYNHTRQDFEGGSITDGVVITLTLNPTSLLSGQSATGTVTLSGPGAPGGSVISLLSSDTTVASVPSSVIVLEGETTATFTINTTGRSNTANAVISAKLADLSAEAPLTVTPAGVAIYINDATIVEGSAGTKDAIFKVTLSKANTQTVTVSVAAVAGTAKAPGDYTANNAAITFAPGETSKTFSVPVVGDTLDEASEVFYALLSAPVNGYISKGRGTCTITDDDAAPLISIEDISLSEGNSGQRAASLRIKLSAPSGQVVKVNFATASGTASNGVDFVAVPSTQIAFSTGSVLAYARVLINGDIVNEANETFKVNLSSAINGSIADSQAVGTIINDDALPALSINDVTVTEGNSGTKNLTFTVTLSKASEQTVTVNFATADGSARSTSDYAAKTGALSFAAGQISKTVSVVLTGDTQVEGNEVFYVLLSTPTNTSISKGRGVGTIQNDDASP